MKRPIKKLFCTLIGVSLIACSAGCHRNTSVTVQSDADSSAAATKAETAAEVSATTEESTAKVENQSFKYRPGDIIEFGKYEQDNNKSNGKEDIEWIVLARKGNKVLVLSRYALACKPYNNKKAIVEWLDKNVGKDLGYGWYDGNRYGSSVLYYTGHLKIQDDK